MKEKLIYLFLCIGIYSSYAQQGEAIDFDGSNDGVQIANSTDLQANLTGNLTIEMWINPDNFSINRSPFSKAYGGEGAINILTSGEPVFYYGATSGANSGSYETVASNITLTAGTWTHIAMVRDIIAEEAYWYENGVLTNTVSISMVPKAGTLPLLIGDGYSSNFDGKLDEVRVWNKALSQKEIEFRKNRSVTAPINNLVLNFNCNQGIGGGDNTSITVLENISNYPTTATLTNMTLNGSASNFVAGTSNIGNTQYYELTGLDNFISQLPNPNFKASNGSYIVSAPSSENTTVEYTIQNQSNDQLYIELQGLNGLTAFMQLNLSGLPLNLAPGEQGVFTVNYFNNVSEGNNDLAEFNFSLGIVGGTGGTGTSYFQTKYEVRDTPLATALNFDGVDDTAFVANTPELQSDLTGDLTVEMWINPKDFSVARSPFSKAYGGEGAINILTTGEPRFYYGTSGSNSGSYETIASGFILPTNEWSHIALVRDLGAGEARWYLNGLLESTVSISMIPAVSNLPLYIGNGYSNEFNGGLNDVRIWKSARKQGELLSNRDKELIGTESDLVAYYKLDQGFTEQANLEQDFLFDETRNYNAYHKNLALTGTTSNWIEGNVFNGDFVYTYNNAWLPINPAGIATSNDNIIINTGTANISAKTNCNTLTVNAGAALTVNSGITLTVSDILTLQSTSTSYSSLIYDGTIVGNIKYERYTNSNSNGNDLITPPLSGQSWADFLTTDTNSDDLLDNDNVVNTTYAFAPFDKSVANYVNYTNGTTATLNSGIGYRVATDNGTTLTFTGSAQSEAVALDIISAGDNYAKWNLIGNPYPSYLDIKAFLEHEVATGVKNIDIMENASGIYGYDGDVSNGWHVITLANDDGKFMTPGQGFFVAANPNDIAAYDIEFTPTMRTSNNGDDFIANRDASTLKYLKLKINTATKNYCTEFYFNSNSSRGLDIGYDASIWGGNAPNFALYSHLIENSIGIPIALQSLHINDLDFVTIPLGVNANQGEQLTFSISDYNLPTNTEVYLEDTLTNTYTLLNANDYTIIPNSNLNDVGRFYLHVSNSTLSTPQHTLDAISIYANSIHKTVVISGLLDNTIVSIYDLQGRLVISKSLKAVSQSQSINVTDLSTGVYMIQLKNKTQTKTQKVILR